MMIEPVDTLRTDIVFNKRRSYEREFAFGTPSICDQFLNIDYLPEIRRYFERLSAQEQ